MLIETTATLHAFDALEVDLPEAGATSAFVVWHSGRYFGCEFREPVFQAAVSAVRLRSAPAVPVEADPVSLTFHGAEAPPDERRVEKPADLPSIEEKAPLGIRLRVIFGSALILWGLIIWAVASLVSLLRSFFG